MSIVCFRHTRLQENVSWWTLLAWHLLLNSFHQTSAARQTCSSISLVGSVSKLFRLGSDWCEFVCVHVPKHISKHLDNLTQPSSGATSGFFSGMLLSLFPHKNKEDGERVCHSPAFRGRLITNTCKIKLYKKRKKKTTVHQWIIFI